MKQKMKAKTKKIKPNDKAFQINLRDFPFSDIPLTKLENYISQLPDQKRLEKYKKSFLKQYPKTPEEDVTKFLAMSNRDEIYELIKKEWDTFEKWLEAIPTFLTLQKASDIVLDFTEKNYPNIPNYDNEDFRTLWSKSDDLVKDLDKFAIMDKALQTIKTRPLK